MNVAETPRNSRGRRTQKVTVKEVAAAARVSMMTVSNVIHNRANVSAALRALVQEKIRELGYVPNRAAQELAGMTRPHFALLYTGVINPFMAAVSVGTMVAASRLRVEVSVQLAQLDSPKALKVTMQQLVESGIDGFLLPSPIAELAAKTFSKTPFGVPAVAIAPGFPLPGMACVRCDERQASFELVTALLDLGHTRIGHIAGPEFQSGCIARMQGYRDALAAHGITPKSDWVVRSDSFRFEDGLKAAQDLLQREPRVTAVFAANDTLAAGALAVAQGRGMSVPGELSIVGYDDAPVAEQVWPGLTTIHQDAEAMTERAVEILERGVRAWRADPTFLLGEDVVLPYSVVRRPSIGPVPNAGT